MQKKTEKRAERQKYGKETGERYFLGCSVIVFYYIYSYISYITNLDVDVGKLSNHLKLCMLYLFSSDQFLFYFIIQQSPID